MPIMNILSATLIVLIIGAGIALYFGISAASAASGAQPYPTGVPVHTAAVTVAMDAEGDMGEGL